MNAAKLIRLAPTLITIAFLGYAGYSINASAGDPGAVESGAAKSMDAVVRDVRMAGSSIESGLALALRDPFQVALDPGADALKSQEGASADSELLVEVVQRLKLDATFLHGREQMAIINGRVYSKGQHLFLDSDSGKSLSSLFVSKVLAAKVILASGDKHYVLGYPDNLAVRSNKGRRAGSDTIGDSVTDPAGQAAMFQKLLKSPLGALGKSLIGDAGQPASRSGRSRGTRAAAGAGNP